MSDELGANFSVNIPEATRKRFNENIKKFSENFKQSLQSVSEYGMLRPTDIDYKNKKEEFNMERLEGSFTIEKQDKGFMIEIATKDNCKILVSEGDYIIEAAERIPEAISMILRDMTAEKHRKQRIIEAKEVLKEEE